MQRTVSAGRGTVLLRPRTEEMHGIALSESGVEDQVHYGDQRSERGRLKRHSYHPG